MAQLLLQPVYHTVLSLHKGYQHTDQSQDQRRRHLHAQPDRTTLVLITSPVRATAICAVRGKVLVERIVELLDGGEGDIVIREVALCEGTLEFE